MKIQMLLISSLFVSVFSYGQTPTASEILAKSIQYHDPKGNWGKEMLVLNLEESRPDGPTRSTRLEINMPQSSFKMSQNRDDNAIERTVIGDQCAAVLNGKNTLTEEEIKKFGLTCERSITMRNYYTYLWGLPMKLKDPGAILNEKVEMIDFFGKKAYQLRITYDANVGSDVWFFYFNPENYALIGYKFYHDEAKKDGEYITLESEVTVNGMRLPKIRKWYLNQGDKFLATDTLVDEK